MPTYCNQCRGHGILSADQDALLAKYQAGNWRLLVTAVTCADDDGVLKLKPIRGYWLGWREA